MNIAVMGGTSHIAANLVVRFAARPGCRIVLFCRDKERAERFLRRYAPGADAAAVEGYASFGAERFDAIIDCIGAGTPGAPGFSPVNWFDTLQKFDDLALDYLRNNPRTMLIGFSSGAVYGTDAPGPFGDGNVYTFPVNAMRTEDLYAASRIYAEAKHRAHGELRIADLRIFSFYSRFISPDAGYFMSDVLKALLRREELITSPGDMVRDYLAPDDLFSLVCACLAQERFNAAVDVRSLRPAGKSEILEKFGERFGLRWRSGGVAASPNGEKSVYCSGRAYPEQLGFRPRFTALEGLIAETEKRLSDGEDIS